MKVKKVKIIAEAGVNHNGNFKKAIKMIDVAKKARVDVIKFQIFNASDVVTDTGKMAGYALKNMKIKKSQLDIIKKYQLSHKQHLKIMKYCKKKMIDYMCSAFDNNSLKFLNKNRLKEFKIPSGEITNYPYLELLGGFKKKIILSTGMSTIKEIKKAISILISSGCKKKDLSILHCNTDYPTNPSDLNLLSIKKLKKVFNLKVGLSDHSLGVEASVAAVALGATIIEKHFTLSRNLNGPDHAASLEPNELELLVQSIRNVEKGLGKKDKIVKKSEKKNIKIVRKSIVAKEKILKGEKFTVKNLTTKRPGHGISAIHWKKILGRKANKNYNYNDLIK